MAAAAAQAQDAVDDAEVERSVAEFIRLDDDSKRAKKQMKDVRVVVNGHRSRIINYMTRRKIDRITGIKGGTQFLECLEKEIKIRPTFEQMQEKLAEMLSQGVNNPTVIVEALQNCGGVKREWRLSRRTRRMSAAAMAAALAGAAVPGAAAPGRQFAGKTKRAAPAKKRKVKLTSNT